MESFFDQDESMVPETQDQSNPPPTRVAPNTAPPAAAARPPRQNSSSSSGRRNESPVWQHFTKLPELELEKKAKCNYCGNCIKYADGTSAMSTHLKRCREYPDSDRNKRQKTGPSSSNSGDGHSGVTSVVSSPTVFKFDQELCQKELYKMFVIAELPFRFVEHEAFLNFLAVLQPRFIPPSRSTLRRGIKTLYGEEKEKLRKFLSKHCGRVCLTTDTWTSNQNQNYMCLTAHFIDKDWRLHKKILNFCLVTGHSGEVMAKSVENCLKSWGLERVFSLTVDNASSNDAGIGYLKKILVSWDSLILKGEHMHMRCCAHIINLIVKEGLTEIGESISRIREAVKYIRSSPSRLERFKKCAEQQKISCKGMICLDVETRWNSTYLMLDGAVKYREAFNLLEVKDEKYRKMSGGTPSEDDWDYAESVIPFLKMFYDATNRVSSTSYITSNMYMKEVFAIGRKIYTQCQHPDPNLRIMALKMRAKYNKYWGDATRLNMLLLIAMVLDPRFKLGLVHYALENLFTKEISDKVKDDLSRDLRLLYDQYAGVEEESQSSQQNQLGVDENDDCFIDSYIQQTGKSSHAKSELDKYLNEETEPYIKHQELDILNWWKVNSTRFPILANIAREVLAIPISTVASESAFSTGGRVLDPYRSSLLPSTVETLICTQDWLKGSYLLLFSEEDFEEAQRLEQEMRSEHEVPPPDGLEE